MKYRVGAWAATWVGVVAVWSGVAAGQSVSISVDPALAQGKDLSGRLVLFLIREGGKLGPRSSPSDCPFYSDPQPVFGINVQDWKPADVTVLGPETTGAIPWTPTSRGTMKDLAAGEKYRIQAALIRNRDRGNFKISDGNLLSEITEVTWGPDLHAEVRLTKATKSKVWPADAVAQVAEEFVLKSELLSAFQGHDVYLRAGVRWPSKRVDGKLYPAIYNVPGFGGDHFAAVSSRVAPGDAPKEVAENAFRIVLDPNSRNGHTLFCDSEINGPVGKALTEELIPALEKKYPLMPRPEARLLRGHSSGGWTVVWLGTEYPGVFGAAWSSSPDPVDFQKLQMVDLYGGSDAFVDAKGVEWPLVRAPGKDQPPAMTVRQEVATEDTLGPGLTSGEQLTSWVGVWGSRKAGVAPGAAGGTAPEVSITPLYDAVTGKWDLGQVEQWRKHDIAERLKGDPKHFLPLFRNNIHITVGTADDYYLEQACLLLADEIQKLDPTGVSGGGYIKFVPGTTHSTVGRSDEVRAIPAEMSAYWRKTGVWPPAPPATQP